MMLSAFWAALEWASMSSGADLFVVCKHCGSQVSPYITECPYCGHRLRRRAPKLPRTIGLHRSSAGGSMAQAGARESRARGAPLGRFLGRSRSRPGAIGLAGGRARGLSWSRPYATAALVVAGAGVWLAFRGAFLHEYQIDVAGPLQGQWWRLFTTQFVYGSGIYAFVVLATVALFGSLLERRHGPLTVLVVFFGCGVSGVLVALAIYPAPLVLGANGAALGLLAAWSVPDLRAARSHRYYEGDLLGVAAFAAVLLAIPFAFPRPEASWAAGVTGGLVGLVFGVGLSQVSSAGSP